jgi:hypothetical protein
MTSKLRTLMVGGALGTTALIGLGGGAVAWAQTEGTTPPAEAPAEDHAGRRSERRAEADAALAAKLGITAEEVAAARQTAHDAVVAELGEPTRPESRPETDEEREALKAQMQARQELHETKLAEALGITVEELDAARLAVAEERLAAKVAAGELTQEQADARLEALRNGELPEEGFGRRGPGGRGGDRHERGAEAQAALAAELGKTTEELTAARQRAHEAVVAELGEPTRPESRPETDEEREALRAQMQQRRDLETTKFAEALGISVDELKAARIAVVKDELDAKVAAGELTQEEADAKLQAIQDGEVPDHIGRRGHRGPGG